MDKDDNCPFCKVIDKVAENNSVFAIKDNYPVSKGHHLIIPSRHTENYFSMSDNERSDAMELIRVLKNQLEESDPSITGFNIGMNSGESAGQTVMHSHIHLIPRRDGDIRNPRGGVRHVIPHKGHYTEEQDEGATRMPMQAPIVLKEKSVEPAPCSRTALVRDRYIDEIKKGRRETEQGLRWEKVSDVEWDKVVKRMRDKEKRKEKEDKENR